MFDVRFLWAFFFVVLLTFILLLFYGKEYLESDILVNSSNVIKSVEISNELTNE